MTVIGSRYSLQWWKASPSFLPISYYGHMIIASSFLGISEDNFTKLFEVAIQLGAILAVVVLYYKSFLILVAGNSMQN
jgi:undecaprenyl pyrophosphate phosphatase UppP